MEGDASSVVNHKVDAVNTQHVSNLVRVGNGSNSTVPDGNVGKVLGQQHAAFDVDVAVDKAREDIGRIVVYSLSGKDGGDASIRNNERAVVDYTIQRVDDVS